MKCQRCGKQSDKLIDKLCNGSNGYRKYRVCEKCKVEIEKKEKEAK